MKFILIFSFCPLVIFAQGEFFNRNTSSFEADAVYSSNNTSSSLGTGIGISILGYVDFGFAYEGGSYENEYGYDIKSSSMAFSLGYNIKRKNNSTNLKLMLGYLTGSIDNRDDNLADISGLLFSLAFSIRIYESKELILMPRVSITYGLLDASSSNSVYSSDSDDSRSLSLGFSIAPRIINGLHLLITPSISKDLVNSDNSLFFGISGGILLSPAEEENN